MKKIIIVGIILIANVNVIAQTYNPLKAAEYASFWCNDRNNQSSPNYNPSKWGGPYIDYSLPWNGNGDCAAFVSQCLRHGGLDLSKGTNGSGAYVKPDKVIAGATELVLHLTSYQNTEKHVLQGFNPPYNHDVGDPMFMGYDALGTSASHSYFCSDINETATQLYSAHSGDVCNGNYSNGMIVPNQWMIYFHIKGSYPDHCYDCIQNHGEDGIDCGGPYCPPCAHAPKNKSYTTNTNSLPSETYAIENITAGTPNGSATIKVLSGQNVTFITAGTIDLLPGFEVESGGEFFGEVKRMRRGATSECNPFCDPIIPTECHRWPDALPNNRVLIWDIANAVKIEYAIYQQKQTGFYILCYSNTITISQDGLTELWNLEDGNGEPGLPHYGYKYRYTIYSGYIRHYFGIDAYITPCQGGNPERYRIAFSVLTPLTKSLKIANNSDDDSDSEFEDFSNDFTLEDIIKGTSDFEYTVGIEETPPINGITLYPNPNTGSFTITGEDIQGIEVFNLLGQSIYSVKNPQTYTINLPNAAKGTFFVRITTSKESVTKKVVVQ